MVIWITGLPGAGKTTVANRLLAALRALGKQTVLLDGDQLRVALQSHAYDKESRKKLALTYSRLAKMFSEQKTIAIVATVSMFDVVRAWNANNIDNYFEVYLNVPAEVLKDRNQKELYSSAESGDEKHVHGFDLAIEEPKTPNLTLINDGSLTPDAIINTILNDLLPKL